MSTNLLTLNQSDGTESGATTGVVTTGAGSTVTSSTTQKKSGARAIKCVCAGSGSGEGVKTTTTAITLTPVPTTFQAKVYASVEVDVTLTASSSSASYSATKTQTIPATTWTQIQLVSQPTAAATDGVLQIATGETQACDLYVDELGVWIGVGGEWAPGGAKVLNVAPGNSNVDKFYAGLGAISDLEKNAIAAGTSDGLIDWVP